MEGLVPAIAKQVGTERTANPGMDRPDAQKQNRNKVTLIFRKPRYLSS